MTFTSEEIKRMEVSTYDEWQYPDYGSRNASVEIFCDEDIDKRVCSFFNYRIEDVNENGWVDTYANIDVVEKKVASIIFIIVTNFDDSLDRELEISITNNIEAEEMYRQFATTDGFEEFIEEARKAWQNSE